MTLLKTTRSRIKDTLLAAFVCLVLESSQAQTIALIATNEPTQVNSPNLPEDSIVLPSGLKDPIEPFNRAMWGFNKGFMTWFVRPASKAYRFIVVKPVRTGIGNMGKNLTFPDKLLLYPDSLQNGSKWYARPVTLRVQALI